MQVPLEMQAGGAAQINMRGNQINMNAGAGIAGGGFINMQGGTIGGAAGVAGPGIITLANIDGTVPLTVDTSSAAVGTVAAQISGNNCDTVDGSGGFPTCQPALNVSGSANLARSLNVTGNASVAGTLQAGVFIYSSDLRLKKDLVPLTNELDRLAQLQPYHFKWRKNERADIGVIAQDVQKLYPELVHVGNNGKLGVEYGNLVAPLIQAVKELRLQNIALKQQLEQQEKRLKVLEE
jgi:hypothetical protein